MLDVLESKHLFGVWEHYCDLLLCPHAIHTRHSLSSSLTPSPMDLQPAFELFLSHTLVVLHPLSPEICGRIFIHELSSCCIFLGSGAGESVLGPTVLCPAGFVSTTKKGENENEREKE